MREKKGGRKPDNNSIMPPIPFHASCVLRVLVCVCMYVHVSRCGTFVDSVHVSMLGAARSMFTFESGEAVI